MPTRLASARGECSHSRLRPRHDEDMETSLAGRLLVAAPTLEDPNFARTVVLLLDHDEDGAFGVVLNRPSSVPAREAVPQWADIVSAPGVVHLGGPVTPEAVVCLGRVRAGVPAAGWIPLVGPFGAVDPEAEPDMIADALDGLRLFAGYAGWAPGQLETELRLGGWLVCRAEPDDAFSPEPQTLWSRVLRRQGGELALLATMPADPTRN
ncbi:MAG: YqgE/AlgH family protein [Acidothermus cellulolyticus]|nr:YqgE/AlgH family protein [Acidothermus cellulolyticus]